MEYRTEDQLSQEAMEQCLIKFTEILRRGTPGAFNSLISPGFIRCNFEENTMVYRYELEDWMKNPAGFLHGGIIASMLDTTMGSLSYYMTGGKITPTVTMKVDYVAGGLMGLPVYVGCKSTRVTRNMGFITCKAWQANEDKPFATADGVYYTGGKKQEFDL